MGSTLPPRSGPLAADRRARGDLGVLLLALAAPTLAGGCVTLGRYELLEARVADLELDRERLHSKMADDVTRLENLHGLLKGAEETLRKSGANLGLRMEQVEASVPRILGKFESIAHQLETARADITRLQQELFDRLGATSIFLPKDLPKDADAAWERTGKELMKADMRVGRALLDWFEASFPDDPRADDALMKLAQIREGEGDITGAVKIYQSIGERYPQGDQAVKALWRIGGLMEQRDDCKRAKSVYEFMARTYPDTADGAAAAAKAKALGRTCR